MGVKPGVRARAVKPAGAGTLCVTPGTVVVLSTVVAVVKPWTAVIVDVLVTVWNDVNVSVDDAAVTVEKLPTICVVNRVAAAFVTVVLGLIWRRFR